jgi:hypothetical protein
MQRITIIENPALLPTYTIVGAPLILASNALIEETDLLYSESKGLEVRTMDILESVGIGMPSVMLCKRGWYKAPISAYQPTILITTQKTAHSSNLWYTAFTRI